MCFFSVYSSKRMRQIRRLTLQTVIRIFRDQVLLNMGGTVKVA